MSVNGEQTMRPLDLSTLNPGIRRTVALLRSAGAHTVDSGDGVTHDYECDREGAYVAMLVDSPERLVEEAINLRALMVQHHVAISPCNPDGEPYIQAIYDPADNTATLYLANVDDDLLFGAERVP